MYVCILEWVCVLYVCMYVPGGGADGVPGGLASGAEDDLRRAVLEGAEQLARKAVDSHPAIHTYIHTYIHTLAYLLVLASFSNYAHTAHTYIHSSNTKSPS